MHIVTLKSELKLRSSELTLLPMLYKAQSDQRIVKRRRVRTAFYSSTILCAFFWYVHNVTTEGTEFDYASTIYVCHPKKYPIDSRFVVCSKGLDGWIVVFHAWVDLSSNSFYEKVCFKWVFLFYCWNSCLHGENICRSFLGKNTLSLAALKGLIPPLLKKDWLLIQYKENFEGKKVLFYWKR